PPSSFFLHTFVALVKTSAPRAPFGKSATANQSSTTLASSEDFRSNEVKAGAPNWRSRPHHLKCQFQPTTVYLILCLVRSANLEALLLWRSKRTKLLSCSSCLTKRPLRSTVA